MVKLKYFFDTEFDEDGVTINLISIGMLCEDGREYYAVSTEFDPNHCNDWVQQNVLPLLPPMGSNFTWLTPDGQSFTTSLWKPRKAIAAELINFLGLPINIKPEFFAHFCSYDWVALCQLYGRMIDLPQGMPFYCNDIKQIQEELGNPQLPPQEGCEHDALNDAKWNKLIYDFLINLRQNQRFHAIPIFGNQQS